MSKQNPLSNFRRYLIILTGIFFLLTINLHAQDDNPKPISICELLKNKKKYNGKEVLVENDLDISAETSTFRFEEDCSVTQPITVGVERFAKRVDYFNLRTNLLDLQSEGEKKLGLRFGALRWETFLRIKVNGIGIFQTSNKPKFGHLNGYKNMFMFNQIEWVSESKLIRAGDEYKENPEVIVTRNID